MSTEDSVIHLFRRVDDQMQDMPKHLQSTLFPDEMVTLAMLFALKGVAIGLSPAGSSATGTLCFPVRRSELGCFGCLRPIGTGPIACRPIRPCCGWPTPSASNCYTRPGQVAALDKSATRVFQPPLDCGRQTVSGAEYIRFGGGLELQHSQRLRRDVSAAAGPLRQADDRAA